jgi:hypothetical protein
MRNSSGPRTIISFQVLSLRDEVLCRRSIWYPASDWLTGTSSSLFTLMCGGSSAVANVTGQVHLAGTLPDQASACISRSAWRAVAAEGICRSQRGAAL